MEACRLCTLHCILLHRMYTQLLKGVNFVFKLSKESGLTASCSDSEHICQLCDILNCAHTGCVNSPVFSMQVRKENERENWKTGKTVSNCANKWIGWRVWNENWKSNYKFYKREWGLSHGSSLHFSYVNCARKKNSSSSNVDSNRGQTHTQSNSKSIQALRLLIILFHNISFQLILQHSRVIHSLFPYFFFRLVAATTIVIVVTLGAHRPHNIRRKKLSETT